MENDNALAQALMARFELHFARQSEILEATTMRMQGSLERAKELQAGLATMTQTLDRLESLK